MIEHNLLESVVGSIAAVLTTLAFVPQAWRMIKTRETKAISLVMYIIFSIGVGFWLWLGILYHSWPMIASNVVTLALALTILGVKLKYK